MSRLTFTQFCWLTLLCGMFAFSYYVSLVTQ